MMLRGLGRGPAARVVGTGQLPVETPSELAGGSNQPPIVAILNSESLLLVLHECNTNFGQFCQFWPILPIFANLVVLKSSATRNRTADVQYHQSWGPEQIGNLLTLGARTHGIQVWDRMRTHYATGSLKATVGWMVMGRRSPGASLPGLALLRSFSVDSRHQDCECWLERTRCS